MMKRLLVGLAVLGLLGLAPASAHDAPGIKCVLHVEDITTDGDIWTVWLKVRMRNTTDRNFENPELAYSFRDKYGSEIDFGVWEPGKLRAGRMKRDFYGVDLNTKPKSVKMTGCHRRSTSD